MKLNFLDSLFERSYNFMKIRPGGAELFRTGRETNGQTGMTKLIVASRKFANAPKIKGVLGLLIDSYRLSTARENNLGLVA
jgi:hypothetical protein